MSALIFSASAIIVSNFFFFLRRTQCMVSQLEIRKVQSKCSPQSKLAGTSHPRVQTNVSEVPLHIVGHWPSAPLTPGSPSRDIATTRATMQEIKDPHRSRLFRTLPQQKPQGMCLRTCQCAQKRLGLN